METENDEDAWNDLHGGFLDPGTNFLAKEWLMKSYRGRKDKAEDKKAEKGRRDMGGNMAKQGGTKKKAALIIDFPAAGETIWSGHYAARINAPASEAVEVRVDDGPWTLCRNEAGHWWSDLSDLADGDHTLTVRLIRTGETETAARKFKVSGQ